MEHAFDIEIAKKYGIKEAIIYKHFLFWIIKNKANEKNFKDGRYWTYGSLKSFHEIFSYMSEREIQLALQRLVDNGILMVGCFNKTPYDRTKWYAFVKEPEELKAINASDKMSTPFNKMLNGTNEMCEPIPDNNTNIITDNKERNIIKKEKEQEPFNGLNTPKRKEEPNFKYDLNDRIATEFARYLEYRAKVLRKKYKTQNSLDLAFRHFKELCNGSGDMAFKIVNQTIMNEYTGLFPLNERRAGGRHYLDTGSNEYDVGIKAE